jgi:hypothetical protein
MHELIYCRGQDSLFTSQKKLRGGNGGPHVEIVVRIVYDSVRAAAVFLRTVERDASDSKQRGSQSHAAR